MSDTTFSSTAAPDSLTSRLRKMEWRVTWAHGEVLKRHGVNMYQAMSRSISRGMAVSSR